MTIEPEQAARLLAEAERLRTRHTGPAASLVGIASKLGLEVWLMGSVTDSKKNGFLEYTAPPRVVICRDSGANFMRRLYDHDDALLGRRGRFTLAHEIGHWLAYLKFDIRPAVGRSEYWKDEEVINRFAGNLLVPDWLLDDWFGELQAEQGVHIHVLSKWARKLSLTLEVVSARVADHRKGIGFLLFRTRKSPSAHFPDLVVEHSASDPNLRLPRRPAVIRSERLFQAVSAATTDSGVLENYTFDGMGKNSATYHLSWVRQNLSANHRIAAGHRYWTSWSLSSFGRSFAAPEMGEFI